MDHLKNLKRVNNVYALISAVLGVVGLAGTGFMAWEMDAHGEASAIPLMGGVVVLLLVLSVVSVVLLVATGKRVEQGRWRIMQTVLAVCSLSNNPPLGTAYGVYALWVCWFNPASKACFDAGQPPSAEAAQDTRGGRFYKVVKAIMVVFGVLFTLLEVGVFIAVGYMFTWGGQEPEVVVSTDQIEIRGMYGEEISRATLSEVDLRDELPTITLRTNGYALGGTLKGWFATQELGRVKLFVHTDAPPYIFMHTPDHWVILGFDDPARTRELFEQLRGTSPPAELQR